MGSFKEFIPRSETYTWALSYRVVLGRQHSASSPFPVTLHAHKLTMGIAPESGNSLTPNKEQFKNKSLLYAKKVKQREFGE